MAKTCAIPKGLFPVKFKVRSVVHALELARTLVRPFRSWTVGRLAAVDVDHTYDGREVEVKDARAEAFCALGALRRVNTKYGTKAEKYLKQAAAAILGVERTEDQLIEDDIFAVNDDGRNKETHKQVLKMFTKAIRLAKAAVR